MFNVSPLLILETHFAKYAINVFAIASSNVSYMQVSRGHSHVKLLAPKVYIHTQKIIDVVLSMVIFIEYHEQLEKK